MSLMSGILCLLHLQISIFGESQSEKKAIHAKITKKSWLKDRKKNANQSKLQRIKNVYSHITYNYAEIQYNTTKWKKIDRPEQLPHNYQYHAPA